MAFELKQNLKLAQQLIMTPQLQQAIKLLQLSRVELVEAVQQELEENPMLEEVTGDDESEDDLQPEVEEIRAAERPAELTGEGDGKEEFDWDSYLEDYGPVGVSYQREEVEGPTWENILSWKPSLIDHLSWQLRLSKLSELEVRVGEQILGNIDGNGYLTSSVEEIAEAEKVDTALVEGVLKKIQEFDPPGVAARDLKECLLIQARVLGVETPLIEQILTNHIKDLETKNYNQIARKLKVQLSEVLDAVAVISQMDPKPGIAYSEEREEYIVPDVFVLKVGDEYKIVLNEDGLPKLRISNFYKEILGGVGGAKKAGCKEYIKDRIQSATWLIKSIQQRQRTIYKVSESIVKFQKDFFDRGIQYLKPMILRDVAEDVGMHESTISRVTTNKYMHTPRGIFELKYFFNSRIGMTDGESIASKSVQEEIRKIIQAEDKAKPLSDSELVDILRKSGIAIARRTVAKYREMMGILPSSKRKVFTAKKKNS
ncbi:MAG TPA: RNA polymerase factor sigma-54 [Syntrophales bacterium]|nr:RNA polymerase factor sigma-54 [Syntrophobacterales bacterium]HRT27194.1 RNA polymerase factor sigma-54 [Syntrophales bacterium]HRT69901.1 RNA polymerase factor sigma-54 [Syntrophales bacterium]